MDKKDKNISPLDPQADPLRYLFMEMKDKLVPESEAIKNDLTQTFWETVVYKLRIGQLLNIASRGEVRTGKSTVIIKIAWQINKMIEKLGKNKDISNNMNKYIFSDQTEFLRFIDQDIMHVCIAIDEFNRMAATGLNATTEESLFAFYSDVFAGKYIHRVTASPDVITDKNANIILDVQGNDNDKKVTRLKLTYRDISSKQQMVLGFVDIYVGDVIENWEKYVRPIFLKNDKSLEDGEILAKYRKIDFYVRYQIKKYKRMDLVDKHGVRDIRELEFSTIVLQTLEELRDYAKFNKVSPELVLSTVDEIRRKHKRIYTLFVLNEISSKVRAILSLYHESYKMDNKLRASGEIQGEKREIMERTVANLKRMQKNRIDEQNKLQEVYQQYMMID